MPERKKKKNWKIKEGKWNEPGKRGKWGRVWGTSSNSSKGDIYRRPYLCACVTCVVCLPVHVIIYHPACWQVERQTNGWEWVVTWTLLLLLLLMMMMQWYELMRLLRRDNASNFPADDRRSSTVSRCFIHTLFYSWLWCMHAVTVDDSRFF